MFSRVQYIYIKKIPGIINKKNRAYYIPSNKIKTLKVSIKSTNFNKERKINDLQI